MLPRRFRLRRRVDVQQVRRQGRRWRHPLAVLLVSPARQKIDRMDEVGDLNLDSVSRFAFAASRRVGHAVSRNRAKRLMRAAVRSHLSEIKPGWDCLFIAREGTPHASYDEVQSAVQQLLTRANILAEQSQSTRSQGV